MSITTDDLNRLNFQDVCERLGSLEFFPFFGTLLGLVRAGDLISGDDDVDFYVNANDRTKVIQAFKNSDICINLDAPINQSPYFLQGIREFQSKKTYVDFYFFEFSKNTEYLIERWNFSGRWKRKSNVLHIDRSLIYPLKNATYLNKKICFPSNPEGCCEYLYGRSWRTPLVKKSQYKMMILFHRPLIYRNRFFDKLGIFFLKIIQRILMPWKFFN